MQQISYHSVAMQQISYYTGLSRATWELWHCCDTVVTKALGSAALGLLPHNSATTPMWQSEPV